MPEEQLFNIVRPYGRLISVKTFTRTVSDKPSYVSLRFSAVDTIDMPLTAVMGLPCMWRSDMGVNSNVCSIQF